MAPSAKFSAIVADPDYQALSAEEQFDVRRSFFQQRVGVDPDFKALPDTDRVEIGRSILFPEAKKEQSFTGKLKSGEMFASGKGKELAEGFEQVLNLARQVGGSPEAASIEALKHVPEESRRLEATFKPIFGRAAEPISKGVTGVRSAFGIALGPFIPRFVSEGLDPALRAAGAAVRKGSEALGLPEEIGKVAEEFTPDVAFILLGGFAKGRVDPRAPISRAFEVTKGRAPKSVAEVREAVAEDPRFVSEIEARARVIEGELQRLERIRQSPRGRELLARELAAEEARSRRLTPETPVEEILSLREPPAEPTAAQRSTSELLTRAREQTTPKPAEGNRTLQAAFDTLLGKESPEVLAERAERRGIIAREETPALSDILADPDFRSLSPKEQLQVKQGYFDQVVANDPRFQALDPNGKARVEQTVLEARPAETRIERAPRTPEEAARETATVEEGIRFLREAPEVKGIPEGPLTREQAAFLEKSRSRTATEKTAAESKPASVAEPDFASMSATELLKDGFGTETGAIGKLTGEQAAREVRARGARRELFLRASREAERVGENFEASALRLGLTREQARRLQEENTAGAAAATERFPLSRLEQERGAPASEVVFEPVPDQFKGTRLNTATTKAITDAALEAYKEAGFKPDPDIPISLQIARDLAEGKLDLSFVKERLNGHGITLDELGDALLGTATNAGRQLQQFGEVVKRLNTALKDVPGGQELLEGVKRAEAREKPPLTGWALAGHFFRRWLNIWKGALVSQLSTAMRNIETQVGRLGIEAIEKTSDAVIRKMFKLGPEEGRQIGSALENAMDMFGTLVNRGKRAQAEKILEAFPDENSRLFQQYVSDVESALPPDSRVLGVMAKKFEQLTAKAERGVELVNVLNRGQEFLVRKTAFRAKLAEILEKKGQNFESIDPKKISPEDITAAVNHALEVTFAITPSSGLGKSFLDLYKNPLGQVLNLITPFPRFMVNSWRFFMDFSPTAFLKLLSKEERAKIAAGDVKTISRAIIGTGLLGTALAIRNSDLAGEKWYELNLGDKTLDTRPFNPFASYLFVADVGTRMFNGTLRELGAKEIAQGIFSANLRAGTGLFMLDQIGDLVGGLFAEEGIERPAKRLKEFGGEILGGFGRPLGTIQDILADERFMQLFGAEEFAREEAKLRDVKDSPLTGPLTSLIPGLSQTLPQRQFPLGPQEAIKEEPGLKQTTGIQLREKTAAQKEADRLGIKTFELQRPTGVREFDRLVAQTARPIAEKRISEMIERESYQKKDDLEKRIQFKAVMSRIIAGARKKALGQIPKELREEVRIKQAGGDKGRLLRRRFEELKARRGEAPEERSIADFFPFDFGGAAQ